MEIPYLTNEILGLGGEIKNTPEDFVVEEIPSYLPSGKGQHIYLTIRRQNMTTDEVIKILKRSFQVPEKEIGKAGIKDKHATTTQTFSLSLGANYPLESVRETLKVHPELEIISVDRHINKLKTGHLLGNRFQVIIKGIEPDKERIEKVAQKLIEGIPNFYGEQRFGSKGDNVERALRILKGEKSLAHNMEKLMLSALQSELFNRYVSKRMEKGLLYQKIAGDVVIYDQVTGPLFGENMLSPSELPKSLEDEVLEQFGMKQEELIHPLLPGGRRPLLIIPKDFCWELREDQLHLSFILPKGAYATVVTREFSKGGQLIPHQVLP